MLTTQAKEIERLRHHVKQLQGLLANEKRRAEVLKLQRDAYFKRLNDVADLAQDGVITLSKMTHTPEAATAPPGG